MVEDADVEVGFEHHLRGRVFPEEVLQQYWRQYDLAVQSCKERQMLCDDLCVPLLELLRS